MKITLIRQDNGSGKETLSVCEAGTLFDKMKTETKAGHITALRGIIPLLEGTYARYEHIDKLPYIYSAVEYTRTKEGERFPSRLTRKEGEQLLRKDLKELCALFRHLGKDSLIIACLAYQVGPYRLLGYGKMPKSTLIRKLESGNRDIYADFVKYCHYKGKKIPSIERRRKEEYERLFVP